MFETERLVLRKLTGADVEEIFEMRSDPELMRFIRAPQTDRTESFEWIRMISGRWNSDRVGFCAIVDKESFEFVGWAGLWTLSETGEIEVGYAIRKPHRGQGFATEAATRFLEYGFAELSLERIVAVAYPENLASQRVMKKLGMTYVGKGTFYGKKLVKFAITKDQFANNGAASIQKVHAR